jgi:hypothetical protein
MMPDLPFVHSPVATAMRMRIRNDKAQLEASLSAPPAMDNQAIRVRLPTPSQLYRRSLAALYAREKAAADFRRISRRLFQA